MQAVIDTETTGLYPGIHEIIQIAVVPFNDNLEPVGRFVSYIKPMRPGSADPKALEVNGLCLEGLMTAPTPSQVRKAFLEWKSDCYFDEKIDPMGHNYAGFDSNFIKLFLGIDLYDRAFSHKVEDTCILLRPLKRVGKIPSTVSGLSSALEHFKIERKIAHDAYEDAAATLALYKKLLELIR